MEAKLIAPPTHPSPVHPRPLPPLRTGRRRWKTPIKISFLVGGGCDDNTEYIELIVDGVGVAKATGACMTEMRSVRYAHRGGSTDLFLFCFLRRLKFGDHHVDRRNTLVSLERAPRTRESKDNHWRGMWES